VAREARPGDSRRLTVVVLREWPGLRLVDVIGVIAPACAAGMRGPVLGRCQTVDARLGTIDVRGPGYVDDRYPLDSVLAELAEAGFGPEIVVALFNGNVAFARLGPTVQAMFPGYRPDVDDEAVGVLLAERWRCTLACCQPPRRRWSLRSAQPGNLALGTGSAPTTRGSE
jgi:hypothetical protein